MKWWHRYWPLVARWRLENETAIVTMYQEAYEQKANKLLSVVLDMQQWQRNSQSLEQSVAYWKAQYYEQTAEVERLKKFYGIDSGQTEKRESTETPRHVVITGADECGKREASPVREVRPMPESRVTISETVDTGRLDGKAAPGGAAPGRK